MSKRRDVDWMFNGMIIGLVAGVGIGYLTGVFTS